jgi:hypothetical protein
MRARALVKVTAPLALVFVLSLVVPAFASAAASYIFEPTLSLTGNCATSKLDTVPDPGTCPIPPGTVFSGSPGADHPSTRFEAPSVTIDSYGDIYVLSMLEAKSRIDVFAPDGTFITEFADSAGPQSIAVDSKGNVYVFERLAGGERQIRRFPPKAYEPEKGKIEYGEAPVKLVGNETEPLLLGFGQLGPESSVSVDPATDQLYVDYSQKVARFGSAEEENKLLEKEAITGLLHSTSIAIDANHERIYVSDQDSVTFKSIIRVFELNPPHKELEQITGSTTPKGEFLATGGFLEVDVDEATGHVFVGDIAVANKVYEFEEDGTYLATIENNFEAAIGPSGVPGEIAVDNGAKSPRPQKEAWLFVPSVPSPSAGHVYAFEPNEEGPPVVESTSVSDITETEATLHATINPGGLPTEYRFEYVSQEQFEASGFAEATLAGEGTLPKGAAGVAVSAPALELQPGTKYRFRVSARNENAKEEVGEDEKEGSFATFEEVVASPPCGNESLRTGSSILLPDCRAYELVTPPDTNGRPPSGTGYTGVYFPTLEASRDGNSASFYIEGGVVPGNEGTGSFNGDLYHAARGTEGWTSEIAGPDGEEAITSNPGGVSPDQNFSFWEDFQNATIYIHFPDGHSELVGQGSLGDVSKVEAKLITEGASHIVFVSPAHLEPNAAPEGTKTVYDRSAEGPTHVVSLLPGDKPQESGQDAEYLGASEDGEGIAFKIGGTIYLRLHNTETFEVAGPGSTFAGVADEGERVFYLEGGDLFAFDAEAEETIAFSTSGDTTPVNVSTGGARAYFVSPTVLTGEPNPNGEEAEAGEENLYLSEEGAISFVGIVTERDVQGESTPIAELGGLGLWVKSLLLPPLGVDPSRTTPAGTTLLFESRADLAGFESKGFAQVYRYDSEEGRLDCLSCDPTGMLPSSDASLQGVAEKIGAIVPASYWAKIPNQSPDGKRAFFQTAEPLVVGDTDKKLDVYEWEAGGVGSCEKLGGCVYLISGGHSSSPDYLYAMSSNGDDVFFRTADQLLPRDAESTLSIYDARVGGGFLEPKEPPPCEGEACHPLGSPPQLAPPTTSEGPSGNPVPGGKKCPKGKRKVRRHGKSVCVKKGHKKHKHHRGSGTGKKGNSK